MRILAETTAAVLVTLAFTSSSSQWWLVLLLSALIMTARLASCSSARARAASGAPTRRGVCRCGAGSSRRLRVLLGPLATRSSRSATASRPGGRSSAAFSSEEQLLSMVDEATELDVLEEDDRELIHSIFEFNDTVVREVMVPRTDMVTVDADADARPQAMALFLRRASRASR